MPADWRFRCGWCGVFGCPYCRHGHQVCVEGCRARPAFTGGVTLIQRFILDQMRRSGKPLRTLEATDAMMAERGIDPRDRVAATLMRKRCGDALGRLRAQGHVTSVKYGAGSELEWRLT